MAGIKRFEEIDAWITSRQLTSMIYSLSNQTSFSRDFGLRDQIRRASVSVMSNIAEVFESRTDIQFISSEWLERRLVKSDHNFMLHRTKSIFLKNSSKKLIQWLKSVLVNSRVLFPI